MNAKSVGKRFNTRLDTSKLTDWMARVEKYTKFLLVKHNEEQTTTLESSLEREFSLLLLPPFLQFIYRAYTTIHSICRNTRRREHEDSKFNIYIWGVSVRSWDDAHSGTHNERQMVLEKWGIEQVESMRRENIKYRRTKENGRSEGKREEWNGIEERENYMKNETMSWYWPGHVIAALSSGNGMALIVHCRC